MDYLHIATALLVVVLGLGSAAFLEIIALIVAAVSAVYSITEAQKAKKDAKRGNVLLTRHDNNAGLKIIYGQRRVGAIKTWKDVGKQPVIPQAGRTVFGQNQSDNLVATKRNIWLQRIDVIGEGPIESLENIEIDDDLYTHKRFNKKGLSVFRGIFMNGDPGQTALTELASSYSEWDTSAVGNRVAYVNTRFRQHKDVMLYKGEPDIIFDVKGKKLWDPRKDANYGGTGTHDLTDESTWEWSDNPALCLLDYLKASYGRGLDITELDVPSFVTAADSCDTLVDIPDRLTNDTGSAQQFYDLATGEFVTINVGQYLPNYRPEQDTVTNQQKRLTCNAVIDPTEPVIENVKTLLQSMRGTLPYSQGKYSLKLEDVASTSMSFTMDDIIGGVKFEYGDKAKRYNRVTIVFPNKNKKYKDDRVSWPQLDSADYATFLAEDQGFELWETIELEAVTDFYQAEDLAEFIVRQSREQLVAEVKVKSKALALQPGDVIELTHETPGWSAKKFRVRNLKINKDLSVNLSLQEYNADIYTWRDTTNEPYQPDIGLATPYDDLPTPTITSATVARSDSALGVPQGLVTVVWEEPDGFKVDEYIVSYKPQSSSVYQTVRAREGDTDIAFTAPTSGETYDITLKYRTPVGGVSDEATTTVVIPQYRTDLEVEMHDIELETGLALEDENGNPLTRGDLSDLAVYYRQSELDLYTTISTAEATAASNLSTVNTSLTAQINTLNDLVTDITSGTADVYVQTTEPVAGVGGVPDPIPANSRWYDSDDANHPYVFDGTNWVSLRDTRIADNAADITALESTVNDPTTGVVATSTALGVLDTTVTNLDGTVTTLSSDLTTLSSTVTGLSTTVGGNTTSISANSTAISGLDTRVTSAEGTIVSQSSDITQLQSRLNTGGDIDLAIDANATAIGGLDTRVTAAEGTLTSQASDITTLNADLTFRTQLLDESDVQLETEGVTPTGLELENDLSAVVAGTSQVTRALTARVEQTEDGLTSQALDITALQVGLADTVTNTTTNAAAVSSLETRVTLAEGSITSSASDIVALDTRLTTNEGATAANAASLSSLTSTVTANGTDITANSASIVSLDTRLTTNEGTTAANATGLSSLDTRVTTAEGTIASTSTDLTALTSRVDTAESDISASSSAISALDTRVTATESDITTNSASIVSLDTRLTTNEGATAANATGLSSLDTRVTAAEGTIASTSTDLTALTSRVDTTESDISASSSAIAALDTRVTATESDITTIASDVTVLEAKTETATTIAVFEAVDSVVPASSDITTGLTVSFTPTSFVPEGPGYVHVRILRANSTYGTEIGYNGVKVGDVASTVANDNTVQWFSFPVTITSGQQDIVIYKTGSAGTTYVYSVIVTHGGIGDPQAIVDGTDAQASATANATALSALDTRVTSAEGTLTTTASDLTTLTTTVNDPTTGLEATATVATGAQSSVTLVDGRVQDIESEYFVRTDVNGNVAGFGLVNSATSSAFTVAADKFQVVNPSGTGASPFSVDAVTGVTTMQNVNINGDLVVAGTITQTQMGADSIGGDQIIDGSIGANALEISANPGGTGERMFFNGTDNRIEIFDASNVLRVALGDLTGV